jgi:hypothetical protein
MTRHLPIHRIAIAVLPGYAAFRMPSRGVWICGLAVSLLSAFGLGGWPAASSGFRFRFIAAMTGVGCLLSLALALRFGLHGELAVFLLLLVAAGAVLQAAPRFPRAGIAAVCAFAILDLGWQVAAVLPTARPESLRVPPWYLSHLGPDPSAFRLLDATRGAYGYFVAPFGVRQIDGCGYPILERTRKFYNAAWDPPPELKVDYLGFGKRVVDPRHLDLLNVGWLLWSGPPPESGLVEVARQDDCILYRRPTARSYGFAGNLPVEIHRKTNEILARLTLAAPETLVVSESWMSGWRVQVDGQPASVLAQEGTLLGVALPHGKHDIRFTYSPSSFKTGLAISLTTLLGILAGLSVPRLLGRCRNR